MKPKSSDSNYLLALQALYDWNYKNAHWQKYLANFNKR